MSGDEAKVHEDLEFLFRSIRAIKALDEADVCMLLLDAEERCCGTGSEYLQPGRAGRCGHSGAGNNKWTWSLRRQPRRRNMKLAMKRTGSICPEMYQAHYLFQPGKRGRVFQQSKTALEEYMRTGNAKRPLPQLNRAMLKAIETHHAPVARGLIRSKLNLSRSCQTAVLFLCFLRAIFSDDIEKPLVQGYLSEKPC